MFDPNLIRYPLAGTLFSNAFDLVIVIGALALPLLMREYGWVDRFPFLASAIF